MNNQITNNRTVLENHWGVDNSFTEKNSGGNAVIDNLIASIDDEVQKIVTANDSGNSNIDNHEENESLLDHEFQIPNFINKYSPEKIKSYFSGSQKWIGHVINIKRKTFVAELIDINDPTTYEEGEFELKVVSPDDKELLSIGSAFYWSIGWSYFNGSIEKKSVVRFQRKLSWTESDYDRATDRANDLLTNLKWE